MLFQTDLIAMWKHHIPDFSMFSKPAIIKNCCFSVDPQFEIFVPIVGPNDPPVPIQADEEPLLFRALKAKNKIQGDPPGDTKLTSDPAIRPGQSLHRSADSYSVSKRSPNWHNCPSPVPAHPLANRLGLGSRKLTIETAEIVLIQP
jgi:hypothetical protein